MPLLRSSSPLIVLVVQPKTKVVEMWLSTFARLSQQNRMTSLVPTTLAVLSSR